MAPVVKAKKSEKVAKVADGAKKRGRPKGSTNKAKPASFKTKTKKIEKNPKTKTVVKKPKAGGVEKRGRPKTKLDAVYPVKFIDLVLTALQSLDKDRKGVSLQAVKKYIKENNDIDPKKKAIFINKSLRKLTEDGILRQRAGSGARGMFKLVKKPE